ncbi:MAG: SUMF1/EgtB/PvdO family nonheme iron enzyme [Desulfobulbaceae bacterium]|nr:SUMF1/EgtB/PvdO family nonheme iron enzyme [Desulfobulbaceae bacterium]
MEISTLFVESSAAYPIDFPPLWASAWGEDQYGLYADLTINYEKGLIQRFRWIAAGEFMMGSPADEAQRFDREDYHRVTLTRGYWLAETAVTQAVWQAVTGENPSSFKGEQNPVERVSWDDVQGFIKQLNEDLGSSLSELAVRLPTEAEWEHACRAGTDTPFSLGENITPEQVNYHGMFPYADGEEGIYREKTVPVKSLPANPWGLYEMHGNVWEWCADSWQKHPGEEPVADPYQYQETGSNRVLRGGSWISRGERVRSAYRYHFSPGFRLDGIGFRLSLGHVSSSRGSER